MTSQPETGQERGKRRRQRKLFNGVAELYQDTRPGYPDELIGFVVTTAGVAAGGAVLDVGCGTGQLTESFTSRGFRVTAIDLGPAMIAVAQRRLSGANVSFQAVPFEDLDARDGSFDLIVSGAAFHWIDPEVKFTRAARLLRPGGWLAVLGSSERYDDPFGSALDRMWLTRADNADAWVTRPRDADAFAASGLFGPPVTHGCAQRAAYSADAVIGVENTRATTLSWDEEVRERFNAELRENLRGLREVQLTLECGVTMAHVLSGGGRGGRA